MGKFAGKVGFAIQKKTAPGVFTEVIRERPYTGETLSTRFRNQSSNSVNTDIVMNKDYSILGDLFAYQHYHLIAYVEEFGVKWKVTGIDPQYPRIILTVGGVYNEQTTRTSDASGGVSRE